MDPCMELNSVHKTLFKSAVAVCSRQRFYRYCVPAKRELEGFSISQRAERMHIGAASHLLPLNSPEVLIVSVIVPLVSAHSTWQKMVR